jgi:hypothetical protein
MLESSAVERTYEQTPCGERRYATINLLANWEALPEELRRECQIDVASETKLPAGGPAWSAQDPWRALRSLLLVSGIGAAAPTGDGAYQAMLRASWAQNSSRGRLSARKSGKPGHAFAWENSGLGGSCKSD